VTLSAASGVLARSGRVSDPRGDVKDHPPGSDQNYDLLKVAAHAKTGKIVEKVTVPGKLGDPGNANDHGVYPNAYFDVPGKVGNSFCDYKLQVDPPGSPYNHTNRVKANIYRCKNKPNNPPVAGAKVSRARPSTEKFRLTEKSLGKPSKVGYAAQTIAEGSGGFYEVDRAPDKGYADLHLH
jgi:hypothetical protein